jgi:F-type H+-transporting ATPase subunit epsilon
MAEGPIELTIVTPEKAVVHEHVEELQIPGSEGYFGVLPGHAPLFSELKIGQVSYRKGTQWFHLAVAWGLDSRTRRRNRR